MERGGDGDGGSHVCSTLEDDGLVTWAFAVRKGADSLGRFVRVGDEEVVESFVAECF